MSTVLLYKIYIIRSILLLGQNLFALRSINHIYSIFKIDCFTMWLINMRERELSLLKLCYTLYELSSEIK